MDPKQVELENNQFYTSRTLTTSLNSGGVVYESVKKLNYDSYEFNFREKIPNLVDPLTHLNDNNFKQDKNHTSPIDVNQNNMKNFETLSNFENAKFDPKTARSKDLKNLEIKNNHAEEQQNCTLMLQNERPNLQNGQNLNSSSFLASSMGESETASNCVEENQSVCSTFSLNQNSSYPCNDNCTNNDCYKDCMSKRNHSGKRKQTHKIEHDSPPEFVDEETEFSKNRSKGNVQNLSENFSASKSNLVSVLKKTKPKGKKCKNIAKKTTKMYLSVSKNSAVSANLSTTSNTCEAINDEEIPIEKSSSHEDTVTIPTSHENSNMDLNSEFSKPDYFKDIEPMQTMMISDLDKLLGPSVVDEVIEVRQSTETKCLERKKIDLMEFYEKQENFQNVSNIVTKSTTAEMAEKIFFEKTIKAKQLGFPNFFNTSNEALISEALQKFKYTDEVQTKSVNHLHLSNGRFLTPTLQSTSHTNSNFTNGFKNYFSKKDVKSSIPKVNADIYSRSEPNNTSSFYNNHNDSSSTSLPSKTYEQLYIKNKPSGELVIKIKRIDEDSNNYFIEKNAMKNVTG